MGLKWTDETTELATELMPITFYNNQWVLVDTGTISSNYSRLRICRMFLFLETLLELCFPRFPPKKEKDECVFHTGVFCCKKSWLSLVLKKVLFYRRQPVFLLLFIVPKTASIWRADKSVFRTHLKIYNGAVLPK